MTRGLSAGTFLLGALLLTACSDDGGESVTAPTATVTVTVTADAEVEPSEEPTEEPPSSGVEPNVGDTALRVGQWREGRDVRTKVVEVRQSNSSDRPDYLQGDPESEGATVLIRSCARDTAPEQVPVSAFYWTGSSKGQLYNNSGSSWEVWPPRPQYPISDRGLRPGACIEGWVLLSVPEGVRLDRVAVDDGAGTVYAEWIVR